jgi:cytochrome c556
MKTSRTFVLATLAGAGLALSIASVAVSASNPVEERQATMKHVGQTMKEATAFTSAATAYDAAKVKGLMDSIAADAKKLKGLYPAESANDPKTAADPKVFSNKADFEKRLAEMGSLAATAGKAKDTDSFKAAFKPVGDTCKSCHDIYRLKKKPA